MKIIVLVIKKNIFLCKFVVGLFKMFIVIVRGCLRAVEIKFSEKMGLVHHYVHTHEPVELRQMKVEVKEYGDT